MAMAKKSISSIVLFGFVVVVVVAVVVVVVVAVVVAVVVVVVSFWFDFLWFFFVFFFSVWFVRQFYGSGDIEPFDPFAVSEFVLIIFFNSIEKNIMQSSLAFSVSFTFQLLIVFFCWQRKKLHKNKKE